MKNLEVDKCEGMSPTSWERVFGISTWQTSGVRWVSLVGLLTRLCRWSLQRYPTQRDGPRSRRTKRHD